ncbi:MAG: hypothetical protein J6F33_11965, partial [Acidaminococcaceae bacterium]|nr:hypothetical protein [Acidaminococcaceae bacterium]
GENGSGKSTLLKIMNDQINEKYVTELKRENNIICENNYKDKCLFLKQGEIVNLFDSHNLFPVANFSSIDHSKFRRMYTEFANGLLNYIQKKIKAKETRENLTKECLSYNELIHEKSYFVQIDVADDYSEIDNPHQKHDTELKNIISSLDQLKEDTYYERFETDLNTIYELFSKIYSQVHSDNAAANAERLVKNQIISCIKSYDLKISGAATSQENEKREYLDYRRNFIDCIKKVNIPASVST